MSLVLYFYMIILAQALTNIPGCRYFVLTLLVFTYLPQMGVTSTSFDIPLKVNYFRYIKRFLSPTSTLNLLR